MKCKEDHVIHIPTNAHSYSYDQYQEGCHGPPYRISATKAQGMYPN